MNFPIPTSDNILKLLTLLGIVSIIHYYYNQNIVTEKYTSKFNKIRLTIDSIELLKLNEEYQQKNLIELAETISKKSHVVNPITSNDSQFNFIRIYVGNPKAVRVSDSLAQIWNQIKESNFRDKLYNKIQSTKLDLLSSELDNFNKEMLVLLVSGIFGIIVTFYGVRGMFEEKKLEHEFKLIELYDKPRWYAHCQSCGKRFNSIRKRSLDIDGSTNVAFCSTCFQNGEFSEPDLTLNEFQDRSKLELKKIRWWNRLSLRTHLKNLDRWKKNQY